VELRRHGTSESATFDTKAQAAEWALQREAELTGKRLPDRTFADAIERYGREHTPKTDAAARWQRGKLANLLTYPIARKRLTALQRADFADWRDARLNGPRLKGIGKVSAATVNRELNLISAILRQCAGDWGWLREHPMRGLRRPPPTKSRRRRISAAEIDAVVAALDYSDRSRRVGLAFLFAIETAMRGGEITRIRPAHVRPLAVHIPESKNGDARDVPLSVRAREILKQVGNNFGLTDAQKTALFGEAAKAAGVANLHFHDARSEAIFRLSKKLDVLELARMIGQRDPKSLMFYYETTADELAARLG